MIKSKILNNVQTSDYTDSSFSIKKEERINSQISNNEFPFQPIMDKSAFSNKK